VSKLAQKGSKGAKNGSKRVKTGQKVPKWANEGVREGQNGGEERKKVMNGLLAHPFSCENGLLSTLSGKGWTQRPFSGGSSSQCELLGHFGVILGPFGAQTSESAKSRIC